MNPSSINRVKLSASRIKTYQDCSYLYYVKYVLKLPDKSNDGARRGTLVHLINELLLNPKRKGHFDLITKNRTIEACPSIHRLVLKLAKKEGIDDPENLELMNTMILVALDNDFHCQGALFISPEDAFTYTGDKYVITGFIDKIAVYDSGKIDIWDYKTNKKKFTPKEMDGNLQHLMYSLVTFKTRAIIPTVHFLFLRFPKSPLILADRCTEEELGGFEGYLVYLTDYLGKFNVSKATANYAANNKDKKFLCGFASRRGQLTKLGNPMWVCPFKFPFNYYALIKVGTGEIIKTSKVMSDLKETEDTKIIFKAYSGCPAHGFKITKKNQTFQSF